MTDHLPPLTAESFPYTCGKIARRTLPDLKPTDKRPENPFAPGVGQWHLWQAGFDDRPLPANWREMSGKLACVPVGSNPRILNTRNRPLKILAIDFANILYRAYHANPHGMGGVVGFASQVLSLVRDHEPDVVLAADESTPRHRVNIFPEYKAGRGCRPEALTEQIGVAWQVCNIMGWERIVADGFEADDVLASIAMRFRTSHRVVLATNDKDLLQMVGAATVVRPFGARVVVTIDMVRTEFGIEPHQIGDYLALVGDASDNIPGCAGCGPKTAAKLLAEFGNLEAVLAAAIQGQVYGKLGQTMKESFSAITMSKDLVVLIEDLPITFQGLSRNPDWRAKLTEMKLLEITRLVDVGPPGEKPSKPERSVQASPAVPNKKSEKSLF